MRHLNIPVGDSLIKEIDAWIESSAQPSKMLAYLNIFNTGWKLLKEEAEGESTLKETLKGIEDDLNETLKGIEDDLREAPTLRDLEPLASQQDLWALENRIMQRLDRIEKSLGPKAV